MSADRESIQRFRVRGLPQSAAERTELLYVVMRRLEDACAREQTLYDVLCMVNRHVRAVAVDADGVVHYAIAPSAFDEIGAAVREALGAY